MIRLIRKLMSVPRMLRAGGQKETETDGITEEKWIADFSKPKQVRFTIKSESLYDANLPKFGSRHCLSLGLKKNNVIAWVEAGEYRYGDSVIKGRIHIDSHGGYAAGGMMFRMMDEKTYYSFLVSSKGYFRLDVVRNGMPLPLVGWTELPRAVISETAQKSGPRGAFARAAENGTDFSIITYSDHIVLVIRGAFAAEVADSTIQTGAAAFIAASYEASGSQSPAPAADGGDPASLLTGSWPSGSGSPYVAEVFLESLSIESRFSEVAAEYEKWKESSGEKPPVEPASRLNLAETYTAMGRYSAAMAQIRKAWETPGHVKTQKELLLAGRLAQILGLAKEAESCISECFQMSVDTPEGKEAVTEMAKILYAGKRFEELKNYCVEAVKLRSNDPVLFTFKGHVHWDLGEYKEAAAAYDAAFALDQSNGLLAKNAANAWELLGKPKEALSRNLAAGRAFLASDNYSDLGILVPKLLALGDASPEAHGLAGKWAYGVEDFETAAAEFEKARALEKKKRLPRDAAIVYLQALLLVRDGKRAEALPLFEEAVSLNPDYALFRFKLAENRFILGNDPDDPALVSDLETALGLDPKDGWINNFAAQLCLARGDLSGAAVYLKNAFAAEGDHPAVRANRAVLLARKNSVDEALKLLSEDSAGDGDGMLENCAGNILLEAGRFEEADEFYRRAVLAAPENPEYLYNRASCLIELGMYGEADTQLAKVHAIAPSPWVLESISFVASRKGEFQRAESACRAALEMDPAHVPSLLSLGWVLVSLNRYDEAREIADRLESLELSEIAAARKDELAKHVDMLLFQTISCDSCGRAWKVRKDIPSVPGIRLYGMPPDDMPAGSCPVCGKTFCIGCAKDKLDTAGRFLCADCGKPLRLVNDGLKQIIRDWSEKNSPPPKKARRKSSPVTRPPVVAQQADTPPQKPSTRRVGRPKKETAALAVEVPSNEKPAPKRAGRPKKEPVPRPPETASVKPMRRSVGRPKKDASPAGDQAKRKRGRPRKEP